MNQYEEGLQIGDSVCRVQRVYNAQFCGKRCQESFHPGVKLELSLQREVEVDG